nr:SMP-30/gluconolactonase/LRE family protein [Nitrosomonas nitrosa]
MRELLVSPPHCIWEAGATLGEGPVWDGRSGRLFWVDIKAPAIHSCNAEGGERRSWTVKSLIGFIAPEPDGDTFIAGLQSGFARVRLTDGSAEALVEPIADPEADLPGNRFNDGKRAPDGSVWAGTMDNQDREISGRWWRLDAKGEAATSLGATRFKVTNGPAFDSQRGRVYLTDSARQRIYVAALVDNGAGYEDLRIFRRFGEGDGYPDGMTVAGDGSLWVAFWDGACLRRLDPAGAVIQTIGLPVKRPTSIAIHPSGTSLFVTSALTGLEAPGLDGGLFRIELRPRASA